MPDYLENPPGQRPSTRPPGLQLGQGVERAVGAASSFGGGYLGVLTGGKRQTGPSQEQIAARAYQLWEAQGKPEGSNQKSWFEAELQLRAETPQPKG